MLPHIRFSRVVACPLQWRKTIAPVKSQDLTCLIRSVELDAPLPFLGLAKKNQNVKYP